MAGESTNEPRRDNRPDLRASDADRQRVAGVLRGALDEGRLELAEYDERLRAVYAAKTYGELEAITRDLPVPHPPPVAPPAAAPPPKGAPHRWHHLGYGWRTWLAVSALVSAIWLVSAITAESVPDFWPVWVIAPWGVILTIRTFGGRPNGRG